MKDFCILHWTEEEQIDYKDVATALNVSDSLSKPTGRIKFHEHMDIMMGRRKPIYVHTTHTAQPAMSLRDTYPELFSTCSNLNRFSASEIMDFLDEESNDTVDGFNDTVDGSNDTISILQVWEGERYDSYD